MKSSATPIYKEIEKHAEVYELDRALDNLILGRSFLKSSIRRSGDCVAAGMTGGIMGVGFAVLDHLNLVKQGATTESLSDMAGKVVNVITSNPDIAAAFAVGAGALCLAAGARDEYRARKFAKNCILLPAAKSRGYKEEKTNLLKDAVKVIKEGPGGANRRKIARQAAYGQMRGMVDSYAVLNEDIVIRDADRFSNTRFNRVTDNIMKVFDRADRKLNDKLNKVLGL